MLLSAGQGTRLRPLTFHRPKPLIPVGGEALIFWHLKALSEAGAERVVINTYGENSPLEQAIGDGARWSLSIQWSRQQKRRNTGGDVRQALPLLGNQPFVLINADIHTDFCRRQLLVPAAHTPDGNKTLAHMILVPAKNGGDCQLNDGQVRPPNGQPRWTWSGMSILHPRLFEHTDKDVFALWGDCLKGAAADGKVSGGGYSGHWADAGTHTGLLALRNLLLRRMRTKLNS